MLGNDTEVAIDSFERSEQLEPGNEEVRAGLFLALVRSDRGAEAESRALAWLAEEPTARGVYSLLYGQYISEDRFDEGQALLERQIQGNPQSAEPVIQLAGHYAHMRDESEMERVLRELLDSSAAYPRALLLLGDFYLTRGRSEEALNVYEDGVQQEPSLAAEYQARKVQALLGMGEQDQAVAILEELQGTNPEDKDSQSLLAAIDASSGDPDRIARAILIYKDLIEDDPREPRLRNGLGRAYLAQGDRSKAREQFSEATRLDRAFVEPRLYLASIMLGTGDALAAQGLAEEVISTAPGHPSARFLKASALIAQDRNTAARVELQRLAADFPESKDVRLQLAMLALHEDDRSTADRLLTELQAQPGTDSRVAAVMADLYLRNEQGDRAMQMLENELEVFPNNVALRRIRAQIAFEAGDWDEAAAEYERIVEMSSEPALALTALGDVYRQQGDFEKASQAFRRALESDPKLPGPAKLLASMQTATGDVKASMENYRKELQSQPNDAEALNNLAFLLAETGGDLQEALEMTERASRLVPNSLAIQDTLGWIYAHKGMHDTALQIFRNLTRAKPESPTYRYHLGATLQAMGQSDQARVELEAALNLEPSTAESTAIRQLLDRR